jgi:hypothetical protein
VTQHFDNSRTGQNITETILTPGNVNVSQFGKLFTQTLDGIEAAQPLYVPGVFIPALNSTHNVAYVATLHDSVYAFDADNNLGGNAAPLWYVNFLDPANGVISVPVAGYACSGTSGYTEFGIQGTPVIDLTGNAIYVVAMTVENGSYVHRLHALDLGTGAELFGGPMVISASVTIDGRLYSFVDKYQQERAALLLQDGVVYIGFGSPGCNIRSENGWIMAYQTGSLQQLGVFDASPGVDASAVWMSGAGLVGDGNGNVYANTGDGLFDAASGGSHYGDTLLKLNQSNGALNLLDYFTPWNESYLQMNDLDLSSGQILLLPEVPQGNFVLAIDKNGTAYLVNQDDLGEYNPLGDTQIPQELDVPVNGEVHAGLTYWNNNIYIEAYDTPVMAYSFANGELSWTPTSNTPKATANPQGGIVSANGATSAIFWYVSVPTGKLFALDATNLANEFYDTSMNAKRDELPPVVHFEMPIVADGRVYVNSRTELAVYGLLPSLTAQAGNNQTGVIGSTLPVALQAALQDTYSGDPIQAAGVPVAFTASGNAGSFSNPTAPTDGTGTATISYTLPNKPGTYTIRASSSGYVSGTFTVTATGGAPAELGNDAGDNQSAPVTSPLPNPLNVRVKDAFGNLLSGIQVSFSDGGVGGILAPAVATTNSSGIATTSYTTGETTGGVDITASVAGTNPLVFKATVKTGPASTFNLYSGDNQSVKPGAVVSKEFEVIVTDQYGNPVKNVSITFADGGAGGSFATNPTITGGKGVAGARYTAPLTAGTVAITASAAGLNPVLFTLTDE